MVKMSRFNSTPSFIIICDTYQYLRLQGSVLGRLTNDVDVNGVAVDVGAMLVYVVALGVGRLHQKFALHLNSPFLLPV